MSKFNSRSAIILSLLLTAFSSIFMSCDSFLNGSKLQEEIANSIDYANYSYTTIQIDIDNNSGSISSSHEYKCKPTDNINLTFKENVNYEFVYWEITDASLNPLENVIHIYNASEKTTTFTLLKEYSGIVKIHPVCFYKSITPENNTSGVASNTPITITFNYPIDASSFSYTISNESTLHQENYNEYYLEPEFLNNNCQIVIRKNPLKDFDIKNGEKKVVKITVSKNLKFLNSKIHLSEDYVKAFTLNSENDTLPPVISNISVKKID